MDYDGKYNEFKNNYELIIKESDEDLKDELKIILNSEEFLDGFKNILKSISVKNFLGSKRNFNKEKNNEDITENENETQINDNLKNEYNTLLKNLESNKKWLLELIIFKYLPRGRRIYVSPYLRIAINPLFIKVSLKNEKNKRKEILKAYLSLILIQGIFD